MKLNGYSAQNIRAEYNIEFTTYSSITFLYRQIR